MEPDKTDEAGWQYKPKAPIESAYQTAHANPDMVTEPAASGNFSWTAAEYIEHPYGSSWYLGLIALTVVATALMYLLTKDYFAAGSVAVVGLIVGVFAARKPKQVTYQLSATGLKIGAKAYPYSSFQSFSVIQEGDGHSIALTPLKRFMPPISLYFTPAEQTKIIEILGNKLPHDERGLDSVERLSRRLRF